MRNPVGFYTKFEVKTIIKPIMLSLKEVATDILMSNLTITEVNNIYFYVLCKSI